MTGHVEEEGGKELKNVSIENMPLASMANEVLVRAEYEDKDTKLGVFCTAPAIRNYPSNFISEFIATLLLVFLIIAFGTKGNVYDPEGNTFGLSTLGPVPITYVIVALGMSLGGTTGYAMNPARDLAPRIAYAICPIKDKRDPDWAYSWVPVLGPVLGGTVAGLCGIWLMSL